jgi:2-keto-4-pentenoate hydratase/2-oxohepta-3-ene-1,7-dioic acid hydratase in catechol pathway
MRVATIDGRVKLIVPGGAVDIERASNGQFSSDPQAVYARFEELRTWSSGASGASGADEPFDPTLAGPPVPAPRQVFGIGLNYADHATESGFTKPDTPVVFTKFPSAIAGPVTTVRLPPGSVDWEVEVVVVMGKVSASVPVGDAWDHVAGLTVGQDLSERDLQRSGPAPQFNLAKSHPSFAPMGPCVVTVDEFDNPDDLELGCEVNGVVMQQGRSSDMIFSVSELIAYLSGIVTLFPGDIIFTGTPSGVGMGRTPPLYLREGDVLRSWIEGIGTITQTFVATPGTNGEG